VVADEVKQLADKTAHATTEIESVTSTMNQLSRSVSDSVQTSLERLGASTDAMEMVVIALSDIHNLVGDVSERAHQIAIASTEQQKVSREMAGNLADISSAIDDENRHIDLITHHAHAATKAGADQLNIFADSPDERVVLRAVKGSHLLWKIQLEETLRRRGTLDRNQPARGHADCRLGKWIEGRGKARHGTSHTYMELATTHKHMHDVGKQIADLITEGRHDAADGKLTDLEVSMTQVFQALDEMLKELEG
jgi:methyl-accepting chemotaxis protein